MKNLKTLIQELCPDGVEFVKIGDFCIRNKGISITAAKMKEINKAGAPVRIFAAGNTKADVEYEDIDSKSVVFSPSVIVKSRGNIGFEYYDKPFSHKTEMWSYTSKDCDKLDIKFLFYYLSSLTEKFQAKARANAVKLPQLSIGDTDKFEIPLPPIEVQTEIVRILDKFTSIEAELEAELKAELDCCKRQYEYYRDKLLSFDNVGGGQEVEWKKMSEVCQKTSKINWKLVEGEYKYIDLSSVDRDNHKISDCTIINKENAPSRAQQVVKTGDILFGTTRPTLMRFCYIPKEYDGEVCSTGYCVIRVNNEMINSHFAYHFLFTQEFQDYVEGHQKGASYPAISNKDVMSFELPIPSLQEQERIANILDRFESLTTSLQSGLPAEIAARRQQYEYYRDKLLTFKRKGAA